MRLARFLLSLALTALQLGLASLIIEPEQADLFTFPLVVEEQEVAGIQDRVNATTNDTVKIAIGGDVMFEGGLPQAMENGDNPLKFLSKFWDEYDIKVVNLETAAARPGRGAPQPGKPYTFNAPLISLQRLHESGVNMVSMANNHSMDYQAEGLLDSLRNIESAGLVHFGAGATIESAFSPKLVTVRGEKIAFIGLNDVETFYGSVTPYRAGSAYFNQQYAQQAIAAARSKADIVIVYTHWGIEHQTQPTLRQREWGRKLIDMGADVVVGAHPHILQEKEVYKGKLIHYSLGNLVFVGMWDRPAAMKAEILTLEIQGGKIVNFFTTPTYINQYGFAKIN